MLPPLSAASLKRLLLGTSNKKPIPVSEEVAVDLPEEITRRAVYCDAGHGFCLGCWSQHACSQVKDSGAHHLGCPGFKCKEGVGEEWVSLLLPSRRLQQMWHTQRQRHVIDSCKRLRWCTHRGCELVIHLVTSDDSQNSSSTNITGELFLLLLLSLYT